MDSTAIINLLSRALPGEPGRFEAAPSADGMPTIAVASDVIVDVSRVLKDDPSLRFAVLVDLIAVDYHPREPRFEILYLLLCPGVAGFGTTPARLRIKTPVSGADPHLPTVSGVWSAANWAEREVFDFFGIRFDGHPDLRRILMPDDWDGFPMRKDYPVQIKEAVKTYAPLQVSEEQFVANVEAARGRTRRE